MTTLAAVLEQLEQRVTDAARVGATAPVDTVLQSVLDDLRGVEDANGTAANSTEPDQLVDINKAAEILGVKVRYLYEHHDRFPFGRRIGRQLRFSLQGLQRYVARKR